MARNTSFLLGKHRLTSHPPYSVQQEHRLCSVTMAWLTHFLNLVMLLYSCLSQCTRSCVCNVSLHLPVAWWVYPLRNWWALVSLKNFFGGIWFNLDLISVTNLSFWKISLGRLYGLRTCYAVTIPGKHYNLTKISSPTVHTLM